MVGIDDSTRIQRSALAVLAAQLGLDRGDIVLDACAERGQFARTHDTVSRLYQRRLDTGQRIMDDPQALIRLAVAHVELGEVGVVNRSLSLDLLQPRGLGDRDRVLRYRVDANTRCDLLLDPGQRAAGC